MSNVHPHPWSRRALDAVKKAFTPAPPPGTKSDIELFVDGWENNMTGLGTYARDKAVHASFCRSAPLTLEWERLEGLYHDDDISGRIVDLFPSHMFRKGWDLHVEGDTSSEQSRAFTKYSKRLRIKERCKEAERWGRLNGGSLLVLGIDDNRTIDQPVDEENIRTISYAHVVERRYVWANTYYTNPFSNKLGEPETYLVTSSVLGPEVSGSTADTQGGGNLSTYVVHESRVIRFDGAPASKLEKQRLGGWTHSVLQRPYEKIKAFVQAFQASANLMTDASQGVYKLEGLMAQISSGEKSQLEMRMMMLDMGRSVARAIILDKDGEEFERTIATISGYPEMLDRFMMLLSAATEIPVTLLMGRSAAGMNATGDSDFRQFYDVIEAKQTDELEPRLQKIYRLIGLAKDGPTAGVETELEFTFRSLWSPTIVETSQLNLSQSQADLNYVTMGALTGEEVAISRFREDGQISLVTKIDVEGRRKAQDAAKAFEPYAEAKPDEISGEMDLKRQGKAPDPVALPGGPKGPAGKQGVGKPNSSMPGFKPQSGR